jgi:hypothetical protein
VPKTGKSRRDRGRKARWKGPRLDSDDGAAAGQVRTQLAHDQFRQAALVIEGRLVDVARVRGETGEQIRRPRAALLLVRHDQEAVVRPQHGHRIEPCERALPALDEGRIAGHGGDVPDVGQEEPVQRLLPRRPGHGVEDAAPALPVEGGERLRGGHGG